MSEPAAGSFAIPLSIPCEHGLLHGRLSPVEATAGLVILAHDCAGANARDAFNELLAGRFREAGLSTLSIDLLARQEAHFPDVHNNVPLLAKRLLDFLELIKKRMLIGELPTQALGLWAAEATSPAAVRVAALRDHDIGAVVCHGGLIDRAGMLYLRSLASPLLVLLDETDPQPIASNTRALQEVSCRKELKLVAQSGADDAASAGYAAEASGWFRKHFQAVTLS
jgi:hypothetical protein